MPSSNWTHPYKIVDGDIYTHPSQDPRSRRQRSVLERQRQQRPSRLRLSTGSAPAVQMVNPFESPFENFDWSEDGLDQQPEPYVRGSVLEMYSINSTDPLSDTPSETSEQMDIEIEEPGEHKTNDNVDFEIEELGDQDSSEASDDAPVSPISDTDQADNLPPDPAYAADILAIARADLNDELAGEGYYPLSIPGIDAHDQSIVDRMARVHDLRYMRVIERAEEAEAQQHFERQRFSNLAQAMAADRVNSKNDRQRIELYEKEIEQYQKEAAERWDESMLNELPFPDQAVNDLEDQLDAANRQIAQLQERVEHGLHVEAEYNSANHELRHFARIIQYQNHQIEQLQAEIKQHKIQDTLTLGKLDQHLAEREESLQRMRDQASAIWASSDAPSSAPQRLPRLDLILRRPVTVRLPPSPAHTAGGHPDWALY
ncbi:hypothetical protein K461DRAFT_313072 [Myriangium duriaei CBS 260.36]|uniref:Uncharacterized protein n=1 Tax=Myriangium duriaei CBS 260.36 TaxID=1168546 RepID=A0A9P4IYR5_9PEZI|nr:hypothetical protein K461DRAFT_313072 [Myriangium duriaei CBS 260.36]